MNAAITVLVTIIISGIISKVANELFPGKTVTYQELGDLTITTTSTIASLITSFVGIFLGLGLTSYYMKIARGEDVELTEIFSKGNLFLKAVLSSMLAGIVVFFGTLVLIIPGIILALGYAMISYLYIDNPEIGVVDVLKKSRTMMKGHKWEYFCLNLSFLGWMILGIFTFGILYFWLIPYIGVTQVNFYESIKED